MVKENTEPREWYAPRVELAKAFQKVSGCRECGQHCCFMAPIMTFSDAMRIAAWLKSHPVDFKSEAGMCNFLNLEGRCHIYPVRPVICQLWGLNGECRIMRGEPNTRAERIRTIRETVFEEYVVGRA